MWSTFWNKYRTLHPDHQVFSKLNDDALSRTAACYFHLDEGRTLKKAGIMVLSFHSCLGFGFRSEAKNRKKRRHDGEPVSLLVNYTGATLTNRFLLAVIPKRYYDKTPALLLDVFDLVARDFKTLCETGVPDKHGRVHRICVLGVKAGWPAQVRCGGLNRSFSHGPKRGAAKNTSCAGVCHLCLAGMDGIAFEQVGCLQPVWKYTVAATLPRVRPPELLRHLPHNPHFPASFFAVDIWHSIHLGVGKSFISSSLVLALDLFPGGVGGGVDAKFVELTGHYLSWCKQKHTSPFLTKVTRDTITWKKQSAEPAGAWNKGQLTTLLCSWFEVFCRENSSRILTGSWRRRHPCS